MWFLVLVANVLEQYTIKFHVDSKNENINLKFPPFMCIRASSWVSVDVCLKLAHDSCGMKSSYTKFMLKLEQLRDALETSDSDVGKMTRMKLCDMTIMWANWPNVQCTPQVEMPTTQTCIRILVEPDPTRTRCLDDWLEKGSKCTNFWLASTFMHRYDWIVINVHTWCCSQFIHVEQQSSAWKLSVSIFQRWMHQIVINNLLDIKIKK